MSLRKWGQQGQGGQTAPEGQRRKDFGGYWVQLPYRAGGKLRPREGEDAPQVVQIASDGTKPGTQTAGLAFPVCTTCAASSPTSVVQGSALPEVRPQVG